MGDGMLQHIVYITELCVYSYMRQKEKEIEGKMRRIIHKRYSLSSIRKKIYTGRVESVFLFISIRICWLFGCNLSHSHFCSDKWPYTIHPAAFIQYNVERGGFCSVPPYSINTNGIHFIQWNDQIKCPSSGYWVWSVLLPLLSSVQWGRFCLSVSVSVFLLLVVITLVVVVIFVVIVVSLAGI